MLSHEIERLERRGRPAPLLDDQRYRWLWDLFEGLGQGWCDAARNHPRHGATVRALLQLAAALHSSEETERRSSLETARHHIDDALAGRPLRSHLAEARQAVDAATAEILRSGRRRTA